MKVAQIHRDREGIKDVARALGRVANRLDKYEEHYVAALCVSTAKLLRRALTAVR